MNAGPGASAVRHRLADGETAVTDLRHVVLDQLRAWGLPEGAVDAVALTTHELVANALLHGERPIDVRLVHTDTDVVVEVRDRSTSRPRRRDVGADEEHGRGLQVVDALATGWGARVEARSKIVWARHSITPVGR